MDYGWHMDCRNLAVILFVFFCFFVFFLKYPGALGSHVRFLDAHVDRTQRRRGCPSSLETRHTEDAHHHTHSTHAHSLDTQVQTGARTPAGTLPSAGVTARPEAHPRDGSFFSGSSLVT